MAITVDSKKFVLSFIVVIVLILFFFVVNKYTKEGGVKEEAEGRLATEEAVCGNGACEKFEWCNNCPQDCGCKEGYYCNEMSGVCYKEEVCGDSRCTDNEKKLGYCCLDCGCGENQLCNVYLRKCIDKFVLSDELRNNIVQKYRFYELLGVKDEYYQEYAVKKFTFNCTTSEAPVGCLFVAYILDNGSVVYEEQFDI